MSQVVLFVCSVLTFIYVELPSTQAHLCSEPSLAKCSCYDDLFAVDCSRKGLTEVPQKIPITTKSLDLGQNEITDLPSNIFKNLTQLNNLNLYDNSIVTLPSDVFSKNTALEALSLESNPTKCCLPEMQDIIKQLSGPYFYLHCNDFDQKVDYKQFNASQCPVPLNNVCVNGLSNQCEDSNATCTKGSDGAYTCLCNDGYFENSAGICTMKQIPKTWLEAVGL